MLARNADNLKKLESEINGTTAFPCDVGNLEDLVSVVHQVQTQLGNPNVVVHNAVRKSSRGSILDLDPEDLERNFRVNTTALLYLARETIPAMLRKGKGNPCYWEHFGNPASQTGAFCFY